MKKLFSVVLAAAIASAPMQASAQNFGALLGAGLGGAIGAAAGGRNPGAGALVGSIVGVAMGTILQQLSQAEMHNRQVALQSAARGKSARWTSGKRGARATYVNKGRVASAGGKNCSRVQETITLADGKRASSTETVCFS